MAACVRLYARQHSDTAVFPVEDAILTPDARSCTGPAGEWFLQAVSKTMEGMWRAWTMDFACSHTRKFGQQASVMEHSWLQSAGGTFQALPGSACSIERGCPRSLLLRSPAPSCRPAAVPVGQAVLRLRLLCMPRKAGRGGCAGRRTAAQGALYLHSCGPQHAAICIADGRQDILSTAGLGSRGA